MSSQSGTNSRGEAKQYQELKSPWFWLAGLLVLTIVGWVAIIGMQALDSHYEKTKITYTLFSTNDTPINDKNHKIFSDSLAKSIEEQKKIIEDYQKIIENQNQRISDTWSSVQGIGLISAIIGVLITVLVLYFSFQNTDSIRTLAEQVDTRLKMSIDEASTELVESKKQLVKVQSNLEEELKAAATIKADLEKTQKENTGKFEALQKNIETIETRLEGKAKELVIRLEGKAQETFDRMDSALNNPLGDAGKPNKEKSQEQV